MTAVVAGTGLCFRTGGADPRSVLDDVDVAIEPGEMLALEGPSGTGKTVLGTLLLRLRRPDAPGRVAWRGIDVTSLSARALRPLRARHQALLQHTGASLPPYMTIGDALLESARHVARVADPDEAAQRIARALGIGDLLARKPRFLSGGEQRRAGLARVLLAEPAFAFVDEPDAGLDPEARLVALELLRARCDLGMACLLVTHNHHLARRFADRRLVLERGTLRAL